MEKQTSHSFRTEGCFANVNKVPARIRLLLAHRNLETEKLILDVCISKRWLPAPRRDISGWYKIYISKGTERICNCKIKKKKWEMGDRGRLSSDFGGINCKVFWRC